MPGVFCRRVTRGFRACSGRSPTLQVTRCAGFGALESNRAHLPSQARVMSSEITSHSTSRSMSKEPCTTRLRVAMISRQGTSGYAEISSSDRPAAASPTIWTRWRGANRTSSSALKRSRPKLTILRSCQRPPRCHRGVRRRASQCLCFVQHSRADPLLQSRSRGYLREDAEKVLHAQREPSHIDVTVTAVDIYK
jgi:hypothetical protein